MNLKDELPPSTADSRHLWGQFTAFWMVSPLPWPGIEPEAAVIPFRTVGAARTCRMGYRLGTVPHRRLRRPLRMNHPACARSASASARVGAAVLPPKRVHLTPAAAAANRIAAAASSPSINANVNAP